MEVKKEVLVSEEEVYNGRIIDVYLQNYESLGFKAEVVKHPGAVAIAATLDGIHYFVVDQFRFPIGEVTCELPAGKLDPDESPLNAAIRELEEEIGYRANTLVSLGHIHSSPGFSDEVLYLYYAKDLVPTQQNLDEDEVLNVNTLTLPQLTDKIMSGEITNAITISLVFKLQNYLSSQIK